MIQNPKTISKYNQWLYSETLNLTASNAVEEAIPGRTHKWIVEEVNTQKVVGVVRFGPLQLIANLVMIILGG